MKKSIFMIVILLFSLIFVSCGDDESSSGDDPSNTNVSASGNEATDGDKGSSDTTTGDEGAFDEFRKNYIKAACKQMVKCLSKEEKDQMAAIGMDMSTEEKCFESMKDGDMNNPDNFDKAEADKCLECVENLTCDELKANEKCKEPCSSFMVEE